MKNIISDQPQSHSYNRSRTSVESAYKQAIALKISWFHLANAQEA